LLAQNKILDKVGRAKDKTVDTLGDAKDATLEKLDEVKDMFRDKPDEATKPRELSAEVVRVSDGQTLAVLTTGLEGLKIRLYGLECPDPDQPGGSLAAAKLLQGLTVKVTALSTDSQGWTSALLENDGKSVNLDFVEQGLAWHYPPGCQVQPACGQMRAAEQAARAAKRGLWAGDNPVPPWEWRKARK